MPLEAADLSLRSHGLAWRWLASLYLQPRLVAKSLAALSPRRRLRAASLLYLHALPYILLLSAIRIFFRWDGWTVATAWPWAVYILGEAFSGALAAASFAFGLSYTRDTSLRFLSVLGGCMWFGAAVSAASWVANWIAADLGAAIAIGAALGVGIAVTFLSPPGTSGGIAGGLAFAVTGGITGAMAGGIGAGTTIEPLALVVFLSAGALALALTLAVTIVRD